jgi:TRAP-type C4-dicarboxylate transport system permease small subunit
MIKKMVVIIGGCALLGATAIDTLAVIGRHIGFPIRGSIELMQAMVLISGATSIVLATLAGTHPRVKIIVDRISGATRDIADRTSTLMTALFFLLLLCGSVWIAMDLWSSHEMSEVLGVPWRWMRAFANVCLLAGLLISLRQLVGRSTR